MLKSFKSMYILISRIYEREQDYYQQTSVDTLENCDEYDDVETNNIFMTF